MHPTIFHRKVPPPPAFSRPRDRTRRHIVKTEAAARRHIAGRRARGPWAAPMCHPPTSAPRAPRVPFYIMSGAGTGQSQLAHRTMRTSQRRACVMEHLPECAATKDPRTVRVRIRSDVTSGAAPEVEACARRGPCGACRGGLGCGSGGAVPRSARRLDRRLRGSCVFWRKYVNVAAALYLVFALGELCPGGGAAPTSRDREEMDGTRIEDKRMWQSPCGQPLHAADNKNIKKNDDNINDQATKAQRAANVTLENANHYKDLLAQVKQNQDFKTALSRLTAAGLDHTVLSHPWYHLHKHYGQKMTEHVTDAELPALYKYLEQLTGAMQTVTSSSQFSSAKSAELATKLTGTLENMRSLLCEFDILLLFLGLDKLNSAKRSEIPERPKSDSDGNNNDFLIFRDVLNFMDVLDVVFKSVSLRSH